jgi:hypothetical protein
LIWNGLGGLLALYFILGVTLRHYCSIELAEPPPWLAAIFFCLWFLPMPFTTFGAVIFVWKRRTAAGAIWLLLYYSLAIFALWSTLIAMPAVKSQSQPLGERRELRWEFDSRGVFSDGR